jgi:hypothetical protein
MENTYAAINLQVLSHLLTSASTRKKVPYSIFETRLLKNHLNLFDIVFPFNRFSEFLVNICGYQGLILLSRCILQTIWDKRCVFENIANFFNGNKPRMTYI